MLKSNVAENRQIIKETLFDPETKYPKGEWEVEFLNEIDAAVAEIQALIGTRLSKFDVPKLIAKHAHLLAYYRATISEEIWLRFVFDWTAEGGLSVRVRDECLKLIESQFEQILAGALIDRTPDNVIVLTGVKTFTAKNQKGSITLTIEFTENGGPNG